MPTNPFFNQTTYTPEQDLMQDLSDEAIQIHGHNCYYIAREFVNLDTLFGEDQAVLYHHTYPIEMYIKSFSAFQGAGDFISKFGLHIEDQCTFVVSTRRFAEATRSQLARPVEGDYIFIQMTPNAAHAGVGMVVDKPHRLVFEIRKVDDKEFLFPLGDHYTWTITCEQVQYTHEPVQTGIPAIDTTVHDFMYAIEISLSTGNNKAFQVNETVYQGPSFIEATATASVIEHNTATKKLTVQKITGTFAGASNVIGVTSGAAWMVTTTPSILQSVHSPVDDNRSLETEHQNIIVDRGTNPRRA